MTPAQSAATVTAWIQAYTPVLMLIAGVAAGFWAAFKSKLQDIEIRNLKARQDRQGALLTSSPAPGTSLSLTTGDTSATATTTATPTDAESVTPAPDGAEKDTTS